VIVPLHVPEAVLGVHPDPKRLQLAQLNRNLPGEGLAQKVGAPQGEASEAGRLDNAAGAREVAELDHQIARGGLGGKDTDLKDIEFARLRGAFESPRMAWRIR
jgi:hypothetical protein